MKRRTDSHKDVRVVVRMEKKEKDWLASAAERADCSVGRIVRIAVRKLRTLDETGQLTFEYPASQLVAGFAQ